jgi:hypothetical protein
VTRRSAAGLPFGSVLAFLCTLTTYTFTYDDFDLLRARQIALHPAVLAHVTAFVARQP